MSDPKAAYTPGPWQADHDDYGEEIWFGGRGEGLWTISPQQHPTEMRVYLGGGERISTKQKRTNRANARLIAAAPDLYEALRSIIGAIRWEAEQPAKFEGSAMSQVCRVLMKTGNMADALAALRKAEGNA